MRNISALLVFGFLFFFTPLSVLNAAPLGLGGTAENWQLENNKGEVVDYYEDSEGEVSIILFWATWCPYCSSLMPHLEVINRKYRSKGLKFYAINIKEDGKIEPIKYFEDRKYSYIQLLNGDDVAKLYGVKGTPGVYVIDREKKVVYKRPGGVGDVLVKQNVDLRVKQALSK